MGWSGITHERALNALELRLLDVLTDRDQALDHDLLWKGYAPNASADKVSAAIQTLKRRGFVVSVRRGWYTATPRAQERAEAQG